MASWSILCGDAGETLRGLRDESVHCIVTSPPYWGLRDYGHAGQIGLEESPEEYVERLADVFREARRVLRSDGVLWLNLGDSYAGGGGYAPDAPCNQRRQDGESWGKMNPFRVERGQARKKHRPGHVPLSLKPKDLIGIPWRVALALQADGWWLRSDVIWSKPNTLPESVRDRPTKAHEYVFLLTKSARYFWDQDAAREPHTRPWWLESVGPEYMTPQDGRNDGGKRKGIGDPAGRNIRSVWTITTKPFLGAHFATFPPELAERCIKVACPEDGLVLDPFCGAGTAGLVALRMNRRFLGIELNPTYCQMARRRIIDDAPLLNATAIG